MTPREQLSEAMRLARLNAGFDSHAKMATKLRLSRPAISRAESASQSVPNDALLMAWAKACGVDPVAFLDLARRARSKESQWFMPYRAAEREAATLRFWDPLTIPGVLQTKSYAHALRVRQRLSAARLEEISAALAERQQILGQVIITAVLDHRVLVHAIGSAAVMAEQCGYLCELVESELIRLHVVPDGGNLGLGGAVAIATDKNNLTTVALTAFTRDLTSTEPATVLEAGSAFDTVLGVALDDVASLAFLRQMEAKWREES